MICYCLNVHFQGQRVKGEDTLKGNNFSLFLVYIWLYRMNPGSLLLEHMLRYVQ